MGGGLGLRHLGGAVGAQGAQGGRQAAAAAEGLSWRSPSILHLFALPPGLPVFARPHHLAAQFWSGWPRQRNAKIVAAACGLAERQSLSPRRPFPSLLLSSLALSSLPLLLRLEF